MRRLLRALLWRFATTETSSSPSAMSSSPFSVADDVTAVAQLSARPRTWSVSAVFRKSFSRSSEIWETNFEEKLKNWNIWAFWLYRFQYTLNWRTILWKIFIGNGLKFESFILILKIVNWARSRSKRPNWIWSSEFYGEGQSEREVRVG